MATVKNEMLAAVAQLTDPAAFASTLGAEPDCVYRICCILEDQPALAVQLCEQEQLLQQLGRAIKSGLQLLLQPGHATWAAWEASGMLCNTLIRSAQVWMGQSSPSTASARKVASQMASQVAASGLIPVYAKACPVLAAALSQHAWHPSVQQQQGERTAGLLCLVCCCDAFLQLWLKLADLWPQLVLIDSSLAPAALPVAGLALAALQTWPAAAAAYGAAAASAPAPEGNLLLDSIQAAWDTASTVAAYLVRRVAKEPILAGDWQHPHSQLQPLLASRAMQQLLMMHMAAMAQTLHKQQVQWHTAGPGGGSSSSSRVQQGYRQQGVPAYHNGLLEAVLGGPGYTRGCPEEAGSSADNFHDSTISCCVALSYMVTAQHQRSSSRSSLRAQQQQPLLVVRLPLLLVTLELLVLMPQLEVQHAGLRILTKLFDLGGGANSPSAAAAATALLPPLLHHLAPAVLQQLDDEVAAGAASSSGGVEDHHAGVQKSFNQLLAFVSLIVHGKAGVSHWWHPEELQHLVPAFAQDPIHSSMALEAAMRSEAMQMLVEQTDNTGGGIILLPACAVSVCHAATHLSDQLAAPDPATAGQDDHHHQQQQQQLVPRLFSMLLSCTKCFRLAGSGSGGCSGGSFVLFSEQALRVMLVAMYMAGAPADSAEETAASAADAAAAAAAAAGGSSDGSSSPGASRAAAAAANVPWLHLLARSLPVAGWALGQAPAVLSGMTRGDLANLSNDLGILQSAAAWLCSQVQLQQAVQPAVPQQVLQQLLSRQADLRGSLEQLLQAVATSSRSNSSRSRLRVNAAAAMTTAATAAGERLQQLGAAASACLPTRFCCNFPGCLNVAKHSELQLVGGKSCICAGCKAARYCSKQCQTDHWKQHKPVCKQLSLQGAT